MAATPADVAKYTQDGVVLYTDAVAGAAIKAAHPDAVDGATVEIEMFFVNPAHAQAVLNERFALRSQIDPLHAGIEVEESLDLGSTVPITPIVPSFRAIDETRDIDQVARTRMFSKELGSDRFAVEVFQ